MGNKVKVIVLQPENTQSKLSNSNKIIYEGINIEYAAWYDSPLKSITSKIYYKVKAHLKAIKLIKKEIRGKEDEIRLIVLLTNPIDIITYIYLSRKYNIPIFHERTEFPFLGAESLVQKIILKIYLKFIIPKFDGLFVISKALVEYFASYVNKKTQILHLPMTVDFDRFNIKQEQSNSRYSKYIAYCGSMYTDKDGIIDLIQSFNIFCQSNNDLNLLLIGDNNDQLKFKQVSEFISLSPYKHRIFCTGWIEKNEIPQYLLNADILALARPDNIQAKGGFPTKLGEYLATGNPVVITDVGEHKMYLSDGVSAYFSSPGNPSEFSKKLLRAVNNRAEAFKIGEEGKKIALAHFNYQIQATILFDFMNVKR